MAEMSNADERVVHARLVSDYYYYCFENTFILSHLSGDRVVFVAVHSSHPQRRTIHTKNLTTRMVMMMMSDDDDDDDDDGMMTMMTMVMMCVATKNKRRSSNNDGCCS